MTYNPAWSTGAGATDVAGTIKQFGIAVPAGWLECDGAAVSRGTYATLFAAIGTTFGVGDGSTTFNVPDFRRKAPVGAGGTGTATLGNAVGNSGGAETHTLTIPEMPAHTHNVSNNTPDNATPGFVTDADSESPATTPTSSTGGGNAHNNLQPSLVVRFGIKT